MRTVPFEKIKDELRSQGFQIFDESAAFPQGIDAIRAEKRDVSSGRTIKVNLHTELRDTAHSIAVVGLAQIYEVTNSEGVLLSDSFRRDFPRDENKVGGSHGKHGEPGRGEPGERGGPHRGPPGEHGKK